MAQTLLSLWGKKPEPAVKSEPKPDPAPPIVPFVHKQTKIVPSFKVTLKVDPEKLAEIKPKVHPFFKQRNYKTSTQISVAGKSTKWSTNPTSHVINGTPITRINRLKRRANEYLGEIEQTLQPFMNLRPMVEIPTVRKARRHLVQTEPRTPFDHGKYERKMWCQKYAPKRVKQHVQPQQCYEVTQWLKTQFKNLKKARPTQPVKRRKYDFVVDDDEDLDTFKPFLVVHGPHGVGKTAAVYTACNVFEALVIECNSTTKKTGAQLKEMLNGVIESHVVHAQDDKWYHCAVLIDEADINLDQEQTFWPTLKDFAYKSRRPIVFTCETLDLPSNVINNDTAEFIYMGKPDPVKVVDTCWKICTSEGFLVDKEDLARLVVIFDMDIRRTLVHLQFWLQMGVGGSLSGAHWFKKAHETGRVVSANNYIEIPPVKQLAEEPQTLDELVAEADLQSKYDAAAAVDGTTQPEDFDSLYTHEVACHSYHYLAPHTVKHIPTRAFFEEPTDSETQLRTELLPILRDIARDDLERRKASTGFRATRRSLASFGLERQVLDDPEQVLRTFNLA